MKLGSRVESIRLELGLTQDELASRVRRLGGSITQGGIDKIEKRDTKQPRCTSELAEALNVSEAWLRTGRGSKERIASIDSQLASLPEDQSRALIAEFNAMIRSARILGKTDETR